MAPVAKKAEILLSLTSSAGRAKGPCLSRLVLHLRVNQTLLSRTNNPVEFMNVKSKVEVVVGNLMSATGMFHAPDDPGWMDEWNEIGASMIHAYRRRSGNMTPSSPSAECSPESSMDAETKS